VASRRILLEGTWQEVPVFDFSALSPGQQVRGPAIIESDTTTVLLRGGDVARMDPARLLDIAVC
ncbi:MAG: hypothetical protein ACK5PI_03195, partial [Acetobacteraceae bacterium]